MVLNIKTTGLLWFLLGNDAISIFSISSSVKSYTYPDYETKQYDCCYLRKKKLFRKQFKQLK